MTRTLKKQKKSSWWFWLRRPKEWTVHGWLMTIAWGVLLPFGITFARYGRRCCCRRCCFNRHVFTLVCCCRYMKRLGPLWFKVHRAAQMLGATVSVVGIAIALNMTDDHFGHQSHAVLGLLVLAGTVLNPLVAAVRPHPGEPHRFKWFVVHVSIGYSAQVLAFVNIFLT